MEATKPASSVQGRPANVALDFLKLAGASVIAGLVTAAVAAFVVIVLSGSTTATGDTAANAAPPAASASPAR